MSHDYAPVSSHDSFELRRRTNASDGVGEGFSLYAVSSEPPPSKWSLAMALRRISACARSKYGAALLLLLLLTGAYIAYSLARTSLDAELSEKAIRHVRRTRAHTLKCILHLIFAARCVWLC